MNIDSYMMFGNLPSIDLHGYDRDSARVAINDFIIRLDTVITFSI